MSKKKTTENLSITGPLIINIRRKLPPINMSDNEPTWSVEQLIAAGKTSGTLIPLPREDDETPITDVTQVKLPVSSSSSDTGAQTAHFKKRVQLEDSDHTMKGDDPESDPYYLYLQEEIDDMNPPEEILKRLLHLYDQSRDEAVIGFWTTNMVKISNWIDENNLVMMSGIVKELMISTSHAEFFLRGLAFGQQDRSKDTVDNTIRQLHALMEAASIREKSIIKQSQGFITQSQLFCKQISNASTILSQFQFQADRVSMMMNKMETVQPHEYPRESKPSSSEGGSYRSSMASTIISSHPSKSPPHTVSLDLPGTYHHPLVTVTLGSEKVVSLVAHDEAMEALQPLLKISGLGAKILLNKNLKMLRDKGTVDKNWLDKLILRWPNPLISPYKRGKKITPIFLVRDPKFCSI